MTPPHVNLIEDELRERCRDIFSYRSTPTIESNTLEKLITRCNAILQVEIFIRRLAWRVSIRNSHITLNWLLKETLLLHPALVASRDLAEARA